jgi:chromate transporter
VHSALEPIAIGLMCSGVYAVAKAAFVGPLTIGLGVVVFGLLLRTRINPVYLILGAGAIGALIMHLTGMR